MSDAIGKEHHHEEQDDESGHGYRIVDPSLDYFDVLSHQDSDTEEHE